ncbi:MAG: ATP-binding cassette domain-containing protein [Dermatophilus congolensis]|nr:ATP-binding cassette domain-containing protein [Dermatophilus congolensis]
MPADGASARAGAGEQPSSAVRTSGLTKKFGGVAVVDGIDLFVPRGAVYGFLGPNGSGKTTTIRMLLGLARRDAGEIHVLDRPMPAAATEVLTRVGNLVEGPAFHNHLTGRANLRRLDAVDASADPATSAARIDAALDRVGLLAAAGKRYRAYSLGMKQRLAIAAALLQPRDLLVLDEPTNGLDPQGTREIRSLIGSLASDGVTVFVSSHLLSEIEQVCTHLGIMREGRLVAQGTVAEVRGGAPTEVVLRTRDVEAAAGVLVEQGLTGVTPGPVDHASGTARIVAQLGADTSATPEQLVSELVSAGVRVREFALRPPELEDLFVSLTGSGFDVRH